MYPKRSFQPQPVPARFAWIATLVVGLCQFPLSSPLRESISQAWIDKLSGHPTETRTPISTLKGWPPSQLEDGTLYDFSVSRSVGLPVSGLKSVQSFGLAQIFYAKRWTWVFRPAQSKFFSRLSTAPYLHYGRNFMRLEVLLYSRLTLTYVDGLPIRARCFWQKRKVLTFLTLYYSRLAL